ncbi:MAG: D-alanine--D-alanine ligase [Candidatus Vogelbacteria bacterium]|nr:D-alanine--D-alanine ligase [Candidatus Vogelbacteria bacterium]
MHKIKVAIVRGGPSSEYDVSLKTGKAVLDNLPEKYEGHDIIISKAGKWHRQGIEIEPNYIAKHFDVVFNAMHGQFGEDGKVQRILEELRVPFTGSMAYASASAMNKLVTKDYFKNNGIRTPYAVAIEKSKDLKFIEKEIFKKVSPPWVIKPVSAGSSVGMSIAKNMSDLRKGIDEAFKHSDTVMVEQYIKGREATCGVIDNFRGKKHYPLLPIEIVPPKHKNFFDYECKYDGTTQELCPGNFRPEVKRQIEKLASEIHKVMGLRHYSRSDFIVTPRAIYALEVNTLPGLTTESLLPKALKAVGMGYSDFLDHILTLAMAEKYK